eukprot:g80434.t1
MGTVESRPLPLEQYRKAADAISQIPSVKNFRRSATQPQRLGISMAGLDEIPTGGISMHSYDPVPAKDALTQEPVREPIPIEQVGVMCEGKRKIFLVGSYKVGKSTLANVLLGMYAFRADEVVNTTGFDIVVHGKNVIVDTEGLNQPMDVLEPHVRRDFVMSFTREFCDVLVLVVDRLTIYDTELVNHIIGFLVGGKIKRLMLIHNVKTISTEAALLAHVQKVKASLADHSYKILESDDSPFCFQQFLSPKYHVSHYFLGNLLFAQQWTSILELIAFNIISSNPAYNSLPNALKLAVSNLMGKYYNARDPPVRIDGACVKADIKDAKRVIQGGELALRGRSGMSALFCSNRRRLFVILALPEFLLGEIVILSDSSIVVRGWIRELSQEGSDGVCMFAIYSELVHLPCKISQLAYLETDDAKNGETGEWVWADRGVSKYGSTLVELRCNDGQINCEGLPRLNCELFTLHDFDPVWRKIVHCAVANQGHRETALALPASFLRRSGIVLPMAQQRPPQQPQQEPGVVLPVAQHEAGVVLPMAQQEPGMAHQERCEEVKLPPPQPQQEPGADHPVAQHEAGIVLPMAQQERGISQWHSENLG